MINSKPSKESERLEALKRYDVLDTPADQAIDNIVKAVADLCDAPIALVNFIDSSRQWFKAKVGVPFSEAPREHSFCSYAIETPDQLTVIEDTSKDSRFNGQPIIFEETKLRFYAGKPLLSPEGHALGTLCIMDYKPRQLTSAQEKTLSHLASTVIDLLNKQEHSISAALFLAIEQTTHYSIAITDPNQTNNPLVYVNKAYERLTGYSQQEILGQPWDFLLREDTDPDALKQLTNAAKRQKEVTVTLKSYLKNGNEFWNEITLLPIIDSDGRTSYFIAIQKDVSDQYKMETALSQSQKFLESSPDAMIFSDHTGEIKMVNSEMVKLFGYSQQELIGMDVDLLATKKLRVSQKKYRDNFIDKPELREELSKSETKGQTKSGEKIICDVRMSLIETDDGPLICATLRNISAKVAAEAKLRKTKERYSDLFENTSDLIQSVYPDGSFSFTNPAWLKAFGYTNEEVAKLSVFDLVHPNNVEHGLDIITRVMAGESMPNVEFTGITKTGKAIYLEGSLTTKVIDGKIKAIRTIFRDVTERDQAEKQLILSKETAEHATAEKSRFLAAASHDLRQPLQSIGMSIATLNRQFDKPDQVKQLSNMASKSLKVMGRLLDVLLDVSKLDTGSITPEKRNVSVKEILDNIAAPSRQQAAEKHLGFYCEYEDFVVFTDPGLLERIIENFVSNAIRYTERGQISIRCNQRESDLLIAVSDSGIGIPLDRQDDIFEEYYQLDNQARDRTKGLGLGLSIVRRIAELLDHPVNVSSEPGTGSVFSVLVPLSNSQIIEAAQPDATVPEAPSAQIVLVVDDDELILRSTKRLLKTYGMMVHTATDGREALLMISNGLTPDILISDFRLPGFDGIELIHRIRQKLARDIPTVMMTGDTSASKVKQAELTNFNVLHKPIDVSALLGFIRDGM